MVVLQVEALAHAQRVCIALPTRSACSTTMRICFVALQPSPLPTHVLGEAPQQLGLGSGAWLLPGTQLGFELGHRQLGQVRREIVHAHVGTHQGVVNCGVILARLRTAQPRSLLLLLLPLPLLLLLRSLLGLLCRRHRLQLLLEHLEQRAIDDERTVASARGAIPLALLPLLCSSLSAPLTSGL